jgi:hypothetical protein
VTDHTLFEALEPAAPPQPAARDERRGLFNRRLRDRRSVQNRINPHAPRESRLRVAAGWAISATATVFFLVMIAGELLYERQLYLPLAVIGTLVALSIVALMFGLIEQRLIEVRLELMMLNGGSRRSDRDAAGTWDGQDRRGGDRRERAGTAADRRG